MSAVTHQYNKDGRASGRIISDWNTQAYAHTTSVVSRGLPVKRAARTLVPDRQADQMVEIKGGHGHQYRGQAGSVPGPPQCPATHARRLGMNQVALQESLQVVGQFAGRSVAIGRVLVQALHADHVQIARHLVIHRPWRDRVLFQHADERFHRGAKRWMTRDQVIENGAQRIDIDGRAGLPASPAACSGAM